MTTRWSLVQLAAGQSDTEEAGKALEILCRTYWYPLYAFARRKGHRPDDAQELTQAFFAKLLEKNYVAKADPGRGRFRTFLLGAFTHFLADERDRVWSLKRGGGCEIVSIDAASAEERYRLEPADPRDPAKLFERRWVTTLFDQLLTRLEQEYRNSGRSELFDQLKDALQGDEERGYAEIATKLGLSESNVKQCVHRMRNRFKELFREEIAQTTAAPADYQEELRHLFSVLSEMGSGEAGGLACGSREPRRE